MAVKLLDRRRFDIDKERMLKNESMTPGLISIVVPVFQEEKVLKLLIERLDSVTDVLTKFDWKYVLINDGSLDDSWNRIKELASESSKITGIDLSRNFGKELTLTAGV